MTAGCRFCTWGFGLFFFLACLRAVRRALRVEELPESWKEYFRERLRQAAPV
jgi:hypothetical protein